MKRSSTPPPTPTPIPCRARERAVAPAYFITFSCYGARIHGCDATTVDRNHNLPGQRRLGPSKKRFDAEHGLMREPEYVLDEVRRDIVLMAIREVCRHRGWQLFAAHVRTNQVHTVLDATEKPERVMNDLKAYSSRALNDCDGPCRRKRWGRHGSTRYLWDREQVSAAINYVLFEQGPAMAVFDGRDALSPVPGATAR